MKISVNTKIAKPKDKVWAAISDIKNCTDMISGIIKLTVLEQPDNGLVGLKWEETRLMFGKESTETMWIVEAVENDFYCTRAESHGSIYRSKLLVEEISEGTLLSLSFNAEAQSFLGRIISSIMGFMMKGSMRKIIQKDLDDIKSFLEQN